MFYQTLIETSEKIDKYGNYKQLFELDREDISEIEKVVVAPYLQGEQFQFDGYFIKASEVKRIVIKETKETTKQLAKYENSNMSPGIIMIISQEDILSYEEHTTDITKKTFDNTQEKIDSGEYGKTKQSLPKKGVIDKNKVFIVHGHDDLAKTEVARFIEKMGFESIILHEKASSGGTIIEKIEKYTDVGFGVVLYTPCDVGAKSSKDPDLKSRARQNVVFEHGFLNGKLGRHNVCALVKDDIETPNDISGIVYISLDKHGAWQVALAKEMRNSGYAIDMNKII